MSTLPRRCSMSSATTLRSGAEIRMRPWSVRLLHGDHRPARRSILRHTGELVERRRGHDARRARHTGEAPSDSEGLHRRAGGAMRILPVGRHHDRRRHIESEPESHPSTTSNSRCPLCSVDASRTRGCCARSRVTPRRNADDSTPFATRFHAHVWRTGRELQQCAGTRAAGLPFDFAQGRRSRSVRHTPVAHRSAAARFVDCRQRGRHDHCLHR